MIQDPLVLFLLFAVMWVVTFLPCWFLLIKLLALSVSPKPGKKFIWFFLAYRLLIIAPYALLLIVGKEALPDIVQAFIVGFIATGVLLSFVRFFLKEKVVSFLWWIYGYVYDGLRYFAPYNRLIDGVVRRSRQAVPDPVNILELGCGSGNVIVALQKTFPRATITGVDMSTSMLKVAKKKLAVASLVRSDIIDFLDKTNGKYDLIIMQNSLYAVADRSKLWTGLRDSLGEDGVVIITNSDKPGSKTIISEHLKYGKWYQLLHPKLVMVGIIDSFISQLSQTGTFAFLTVEEIAEETKGIFTIHEVERAYGDVNVLFELRHASRSKP